MFFVPATARHVFGAVDPQSAEYTRGMEWGGFAFSFYSITCFIIAFALPVFARRTSRKVVHAAALAIGGISLLSMGLVRDQYLLLLIMVGVGVAWSSILSMPYAILSSALPPARMGVYMGIFNAFIVLPEISAAIGFGPIIRWLLGSDNPNAPLFVVMAGGGCMLIAAACVSFVRDVATTPVEEIPTPPLERVT
jgi:maltose/moltooligosaccharide transporter